MGARRGDLVRRTVLVAATALALTSVAAHSACLLVDPGGDLPSIPRRRPFIVQSEVVPPASRVLGVFPEKLIVPVELADPKEPFVWAVFYDYNPLTGAGLEKRATSTFAPSNVVNGLRVEEIALAAPTELDQCHTIEVVVALSSGLDGIAAHTPLDPGGDSVSWFYSPSGDLSGCPALDAGVDAAFVVREGGAEGGPQ